MCSLSSAATTITFALPLLIACSAAPPAKERQTPAHEPPQSSSPTNSDSASGAAQPNAGGAARREPSGELPLQCPSVPGPIFTPYLGPYLTLLSPSASLVDGEVRGLDPSSSVVINFERAPETGWIARICYRPVGTKDWVVADEVLTGRSMHHFHLEGLSAGTDYEYVLLDPDNAASETFRFSTVSAHPDEAHFLVIGDMQDQDEKQRWSEVAHEIAKTHLDEFDFILCVGDMVADDWEKDGDRYYFWKLFFDRGRELFSRKPMFATPGNHDTPAYPWSSDQPETYWSNAEDTESYRKYFGLPQQQSFADSYAFDFGPARFLSINSEVPVFYGRNPELDQWGRVEDLRQFIATETGQATPEEWLFTFSHVPPVNPSGGKDEVQYMRPYTDLFAGKVDWSFSGHTHQNQRLHPAEVRADSHELRPSYGKGPSDGTGYLIVPPAGQWPRVIDNWTDKLAFSPEHQGTPTYEIGFVLVDVSGDHFSLRTYGMGDVDGRNPGGYLDDGTSRLIDEVSYSR